MRICLHYRGRLGDICQLLHTAHVLAKRKHKVAICCWPRYADIMKCCSYVEWVNPYLLHKAKFDRVFNLGIHPYAGGSHERFRDYRESRKKWSAFVIDSVPELAWTYGPPRFDKLGWFDRERYGLPEVYALVAPHGYSQQQRHRPEDIINLARRTYGQGIPLYVLVDHPPRAPHELYARRLRDMPGMIAGARHFMAINSSPAIIAAGVRKSYEHIPQVGAAAQDDTAFDGISIKVKP